jgi:hypothetical protein
MMRRAFAVAIAAAVLLGLMVAPAQAQITNGPVRLKSNTNSSYCLSILAYGRDDGNHIVHWDCFGEPNEVFTLVHVGVIDVVPLWQQLLGLPSPRADVYQIRSNWSGRCMSAEDGDTSSGTTVVQYGCNNSRSRLWVPVSRGGSNYSFVNANTLAGLFDNPRCLDVRGATSGRTSMQIWTCNQETGAQTFTLQPA